MAVSDVFPGSHQDETISRFDQAVRLIRFAPLFVGFAFVLLSQPGVTVDMVGAYLVADGGYQVGVGCTVFVAHVSFAGLANFSAAAQVHHAAYVEALLCPNCLHKKRRGMHVWKN